MACPAKRNTLYTEKQLEAAHRAFPLDAAEPASDDDEHQRSVLLGRKAVSLEADQAEADRDQVERERECQAANLHEHDKIAEARLDQFSKIRRYCKRLSTMSRKC